MFVRPDPEATAVNDVELAPIAGRFRLHDRARSLVT
jgi:hypothetical protein